MTNLIDEDVQRLAEKIEADPKWSALVVAETSVIVRGMSRQLNRLRNGLIVLLLGLVADLALRILTTTDVASAVGF